MHKGGVKLEHFIILMDDWAESTFGFHCVYSTAAVVDVWIFHKSRRAKIVDRQFA